MARPRFSVAAVAAAAAAIAAASAAAGVATGAAADTPMTDADTLDALRRYLRSAFCVETRGKERGGRWQGGGRREEGGGRREETGGMMEEGGGAVDALSGCWVDVATLTVLRSGAGGCPAGLVGALVH